MTRPTATIATDQPTQEDPMMDRPPVLETDRHLVRVALPCPICGAPDQARMHADEHADPDVEVADALVDCLECEAGYAAAEARWDNEAERMHEAIRDWQAERLHGGR